MESAGQEGPEEPERPSFSRRLLAAVKRGLAVAEPPARLVLIVVQIVQLIRA
ncbi:MULTISPECIES: hypothetical protein [unclassified Streptomyces]|uniref:hypothetical protein n=1 Tax=unclassified Streptomyces TaxID=2593676 RepID=UPI003626BE52